MFRKWWKHWKAQYKACIAFQLWLPIPSVYKCRAGTDRTIRLVVVLSAVRQQTRLLQDDRPTEEHGQFILLYSRWQVVSLSFSHGYTTPLYINVIRDPLERYVSMYYYKWYDSEGSYSTMTDQQRNMVSPYCYGDVFFSKGYLSVDSLRGK